MLMVLLGICIIVGFVWMLFHRLVYGGNDPASAFTFLFGFLGAFLTLLTMSFITWFVFHFVSNFWLSVRTRGYYSSDLFLFEVGLIFFVLIVFTFWYYSYVSKTKRGVVS